MGNKVEIEITSSTGESVRSEDAVEKEEQQRERTKRRAAADARAARAEGRAEDASRRAAQRELDRIADRAARERKREQKEFEADEKRLDRERKKRVADALRDERRRVAEARSEQTLRRRFINDMLGAFNNAHMGRRVNHAIDFINAMTGNVPRVQTAGVGQTGSASGGGGFFSTAAGAAVGGANRSNAAQIAVGVVQGIKTTLGSILDSLSRSMRSLMAFLSRTAGGIAGTARDAFAGSREFFFGRRHRAQPFRGFDDGTRRAGTRPTPGHPDDITRWNIPPRNLPAPRSGVGTTAGMAAAAGGVPLIGGTGLMVASSAGVPVGGATAGAIGTTAGTALTVEGAVLSTTVGGVTTTGGAAGTALVAGGGGAGGGLITTGAGAAGGTAAAGAAGGPIGLAIAAAIIVTTGAVVVGFAMADKAARKFAKTVEGFPGGLLFAQVESDLKMFSRKMQRSQEFGDVLGDIERRKTDQKILGMDIKDSIIGPLLPMVRDGHEVLVNILKFLKPLANVVGEIFGLIGKSFERLFAILNAFFEKIEEFREWFISLVEPIAPDLAKWLRKQLLHDPLKDIDNDILTELYRNFFNAPFVQGKNAQGLDRGTADIVDNLRDL